jgi:hypothetical protein
MRRLLPTLVLAGSLVIAPPAIAADDDADASTSPAGQAAPAKAPVFLTIVPEGSSVRSVADEEARSRQEQVQQERTSEGLLATVQSLQRIGLFALQFILALLAAGLVGGLLAAVVLWLRSRLRPAEDPR